MTARNISAFGSGARSWRAGLLHIAREHGDEFVLKFAQRFQLSLVKPFCRFGIRGRRKGCFKFSDERCDNGKTCLKLPKCQAAISIKPGHCAASLDIGKPKPAKVVPPLLARSERLFSFDGCLQDDLPNASLNLPHMYLG